MWVCQRWLSLRHLGMAMFAFVVVASMFMFVVVIIINNASILTLLERFFLIVLMLAFNHIVRDEVVHPSRNDLNADNPANETRNHDPRCFFRREPASFE
jgi:hypothetical protein